ncbi:TetR/AcrR family transcriptional regulator [Streptomyces sp. NPDC127079]|uniref:TetR/AcrR family transcriptional regulator n=1 Tax=Streptomyces sp. NPDC127079 TaxID=3347132 RepID=UPI003657A833
MLDATVEIAGERGYEGTSIAAVSAKCGLPGVEAGTPLERVTLMAANVARSLVRAPDFLRLGLMLALERRPTEPRGRTVFLQVREIAEQRVAEVIATLFQALPDDDVRTLTTYAVAGADGLFVHREVDGDAVDLVALFALHARLVYAAADRPAARAER